MLSVESVGGKELLQRVSGGMLSRRAALQQGGGAALPGGFSAVNALQQQAQQQAQLNALGIQNIQGGALPQVSLRAPVVLH